MLRKMSASEYREWMAYELIEPFSIRRQDINAANIIHHNNNATAKDYKGSIDNYMLDYEGPLLTEEEKYDRDLKRRKKNSSGTMGEFAKKIEGK